MSSPQPPSSPRARPTFRPTAVPGLTPTRRYNNKQQQNVVVVKGTRSKLCFGGAPSGSGASSLSVQLPSSPVLWSPEPATTPSAGVGSRGRAKPLECKLRGLFECKAAADDKENDKKAPSKKASPIGATCCICLEDMTPDKPAHQLSCPQCTMRAHATCLEQWFASDAAAKGNRVGQPVATLPKTTASCPSCRCELDWDALALQARRTYATAPRLFYFILSSHTRLLMFAGAKCRSAWRLRRATTCSGRRSRRSRRV